MKAPKAKKKYILRVRIDQTVLKHIHQLKEKRNVDMSKIIRSLVELEHENEFPK